jgi:hypothetical protein
VASAYDIDHFIEQHLPPQAVKDLGQSTKDEVGLLLDHYRSTGYRSEDVAAVLDEKLGSTDLAQAGERELTEAVQALAEPLKQTGGQTPGGQVEQQQAGPSAEQILAELGNAAGQDVAETFATAMPGFVADTVAEVWAAVRAQIVEDMAADPTTWGEPDAREALRETAYYALMEALTGFCEAGAATGFPLPTAQ